MRYKVYDTSLNKFVTDNDDRWILKPDGRLAINEDGDEIGIPNCIPIFYPDKSEHIWIDEIGGLHEEGVGYIHSDNYGWEYCGECSHVSCTTCGAYKEICDIDNTVAGEKSGKNQ